MALFIDFIFYLLLSAFCVISMYYVPVCITKVLTCNMVFLIFLFFFLLFTTDYLALVRPLILHENLLSKSKLKDIK